MSIGLFVSELKILQKNEANSSWLVVADEMVEYEMRCEEEICEFPFLLFFQQLTLLGMLITELNG